MGVHDRPRATKDLDVWVRPSSENASRVWRALGLFGAPLENLTIGDLIDADTVFQIGVAPLRIDILTSISGVDFETAWQHRVIVDRDGFHPRRT